MILRRIRQALNNNDGAATPMILAFILACVVAFAILFQYFYVTATLKTIRQSCFSVSESLLVANAEASYQAKRDGYTGIWHVGPGEFSDPTVHVDPISSLAEQLNIVIEGDTLVKRDGDKQVYRLRDISLTINNPEFQDSDILLTSSLSLIVDINLNFPLVDKFPVSIPIHVTSSWDRKF